MEQGRTFQNTTMEQQLQHRIRRQCPKNSTMGKNPLEYFESNNFRSKFPLFPLEFAHLAHLLSRIGIRFLGFGVGKLMGFGWEMLIGIFGIDRKGACFVQKRSVDSWRSKTAMTAIVISLSARADKGGIRESQRRRSANVAIVDEIIALDLD
ncbi:hypothetical protein Droror1_Dr00002354 [Drosera rotundifolia]